MLLDTTITAMGVGLECICNFFSNVPNKNVVDMLSFKYSDIQHLLGLLN